MKSLFFFLLVFTGFASSSLHAQQEELPTISDALAEDASTSTLLSALQASGLLDELAAEDGDYIILAPTDEAFGALPEGVVESLLEPENVKTLRSLLAFHVTTDGDDGMIAQKLSDGGASAAKVTQCANGKIYTIDRVLLPPNFDAKEE